MQAQREAELNALADAAERGELTVKPGTVKRGSASRQEMQALLMEATGTASVEEMARLALGRPRAGSAAGESPVIRARVPQEIKNAFAVLAQREERNEADLVREALAEYLVSRRAG
ncbi:ribbon-helix-helix protein, CopG family [Galactobacter valiniphilus]|uniref:ribbon-helix-helix protein, CopG family n=1 Tax=Galactobacter valiniphilus TaxID=2676122 RepID=UPI0018F3B26F|nr:ribbon-helix-helix protein, CopG family [Galactobacter valiniphilus]